MAATVNDLSFDDLAEGLEDEVEWTVTEGEIDAFAELSGDVNPLHMDQTYARDAGYDGRVAHGFLLGAKLSGLIGTKLPGRRCLLVGQQLDYPNPIYVGDRITISGRIADRRDEFNLVTLKVRAAKSARGETVTVARGTVTCKVLS